MLTTWYYLRWTLHVEGKSPLNLRSTSGKERMLPVDRRNYEALLMTWLKLETLTQQLLKCGTILEIIFTEQWTLAYHQERYNCWRLWFVRDTCQMMSMNIMSKAKSTALSDFGTLIGLHDQRNLEWPFKSVLTNNQSQCGEYRIREWFLTSFAE